MKSRIFREVLAADVAVEMGIVTVERAAEALALYWETGKGTVLRGVSEEDRARVESEIDRLLETARGDERTAVAIRGVDRELPARMKPSTSHALQEVFGRLRAPLRPLDKRRYVSFMPMAEGGMGVVYLALDTELNRRVAFKMVRPGKGSGTPDPLADESEPVPEDMIARFMQEAVVTGGLEHPGIVPVYELGMAPSGVPYYTMRLVRGERTLDDAIREVASFEERLKLVEAFLKVCDAIAYAHSRGVVHRDLKPDNIALGAFGEVVVLDWGLAKMQSRPDLTGSRWQTRLEELRDVTDLKTIASALGTPGYMAPECAGGRVEEIDTRADVYSLGAILHRILTGRFPFEFSSLHEYLAKLRVGITEVAGVPAGLEGVCLRALANEPSDRFRSVTELAEAVRAWQGESAIARQVDVLVGEAVAHLDAAEGLEGDALLRQLDRTIASCGRIVALRPGDQAAETLRTRARDLRAEGLSQSQSLARTRLLRRVGVVGLAVAMAATLVVAFLLDARRREAETARAGEETQRLAAETARGVADRERARAEVARGFADDQRAGAEDLASFMLGDLHEGLAPVGRLDLLGKIARKSLAYYESLPSENVDDAARRARALALGRIGEVLQDTGNLDEAAASCAASLEAFEALSASAPGNEEWRAELATAHNRSGDVDREMGEFAAALAHYRRSAELRRGIGDEEALTRSLDRVGAILNRTGRGDEALAPYRESLDIRRKLVRQDPLNDEWQYGLATGLESWGDIVMPSEGVAVSQRYYEEGAAILRRLIAKDASQTEWRSSLAGIVFRIGHCQAESGDPAAALASYRESLAVYRGLAELDPTNAWWQRNVALSLSRIGQRLNDDGDIEGAITHYRESVEIHKAVAERDPSNLRTRQDLITQLILIGDLALNSRDPSSALPSYESALSISRRLVEAHPDDTRALDDLGRSLVAIGKLRVQEERGEEAKPYLEESLKIARGLAAAQPDVDEWHGDVARRLETLGTLARAAGDVETARKHYFESLEINEGRILRDESDPRRWSALAQSCMVLGGLEWGAGDTAKAMQYYERALPLHRRIASQTQTALARRELAVCLFNMGTLDLNEGRPKEALARLRESTVVHRTAQGYERERRTFVFNYAFAVDRAGAETAGDHLEHAYLLYQQKEIAKSADAFAAALEDAEIRGDLTRGNLYNAACSAALAGRSEQALAWLSEDLRRRREKGGPELAPHVEHARVNDADLDSIRSLDAFKALFAE